MAAMNKLTPPTALASGKAPDPSAPRPPSFLALDEAIDRCRDYADMKTLAAKYGCETWGQLLMMVWLPMKNAALPEKARWQDWRTQNGYELPKGDSLTGLVDRRARIRDAYLNPPPKPESSPKRGARRATNEDAEIEKDVATW